MSSNRAFKGLANLRNSFQSPDLDDTSARVELPDTQEPRLATFANSDVTNIFAGVKTPPSIPLTLRGKVDRRRLRKVLKTPSVSLSVEVRAELHNDVRMMLFARNSTWIALLDELLIKYVNEAKIAGTFPK